MGVPLTAPEEDKNENSRGGGWTGEPILPAEPSRSVPAPDEYRWPPDALDFRDGGAHSAAQRTPIISPCPRGRAAGPQGRRRRGSRSWCSLLRPPRGLVSPGWGWRWSVLGAVSRGLGGPSETGTRNN